MGDRLKKAVSCAVAIAIALVLGLSMVPAAAMADSVGTMKLGTGDDFYAAADKALREHKTLAYNVNSLSAAQKKGLEEFRKSWNYSSLGTHSAKLSQSIIDRELAGCWSWHASGWKDWSLSGFHSLSASQSAKISKAIDSCVRKAKKKKGKKAKLAYCYKWTMSKFSYLDAAKHGTAGAAFLNGKGVCYQYAVVFAATVRKLGIDARLAVGNYHGKKHMLVKIGSKYYDATWDDGKKMKKWKYFGVSKKHERKKGLKF